MPSEARLGRSMRSSSSLFRDARAVGSHDSASVHSAQREWTIFEDLFLQNRTDIESQRPATVESSLSSTGPRQRTSVFASGLYSEFEGTGALIRTESTDVVGSDGRDLGERATSPISMHSLSPTRHFPAKSRNWFSLPQLSTVQKDIIKCAMAYLLGSLFTFVPYFASIISDIVPTHGSTGPSPSGHMVATGT